MRQGGGERGADGIMIHAVGYAHLDPAWLWPWTEGYQEARATFRSALDRMKEFPDYVFACSQAAVYRWVEENDPAMVQEIAERVREGRWCIVGGWWMEADCNIPGGESFARQGLYGQRYFRERFGVTARTGFCPDSFGHNAMIPQLAKQAGMSGYVFMRPDRIENPACPSPAFRWRSPDGTTVLAYRLTHSYCTDGEELSESLVEQIAAWGGGPIRHLMMFYGVGNHGGGPTIRNLESIDRLRAPAHPRLVHGSPDTCLAELGRAEDTLPCHEGEWQHHASGCYAAHAEIKRLNRRAENDLAAAEALSVLAARLAGWEYGRGETTRAWKNVLFCQFHDIMAGSCIPEACRDAEHMLGEALRIAAYETNGAAQRLAARVDTTGPGVPVIVFNPHSFPVRAAVECGMPRGTAGDPEVTDEEDREVLCQATAAPAMHVDMRRLCFLAELPALGYRTYRIRDAGRSPSGAPRPEAEAGGLSWGAVASATRMGYALHPDGRGDLRVENEWFRMEIDGHTGDIRRLQDKRCGLEVFRGSAAVPVVMDDPSDTWSHGVLSYDVPRGRFAEARVRVVEEGPLRIVIRAKSRYGRSTLTQDFILYRGLPWISVRAKADWHETLAVLKISFPVNVESPVATYEIPYGHIERPVSGEEQPGQRWMDVSGTAVAAGGLPYGLGILNDSLYSSDVRGSDARITVLRSPAYAHHTPATLTPDGDHPFMDQGEHAFAYELVPHPGAWQEAGIVREACVLNAPPFALVEHVHAGSLPPAAEHIRVSAPHVVVTALKMREEARDIVVRCHETAGRAADVTLDLPFAGRKATFSIGPSQVKTFIFPADGNAAVRETNFLED